MGMLKNYIIKRALRRQAKRTLPGLAVLGAAAVGVAVWRRLRWLDLRGQVVLITGGSRGLGLAMARKFAEQGARLALCAREWRELEIAKAELEDLYDAEVLITTCDVSHRDEVQDWIRAVRAHYGTIDVLVNNAGMISVTPLENATVEDFESAMGTMFWGVVYPTLEVLGEMKRKGAGRIATITSVGGKVSVPHLLPYSCAKFAAVAFCEGLRAELAPCGVKVTTIAPGLMRTGSHLKAEFKGRHADEAAWFSLLATMPGMSMSAERAASQVVCAVRSGTSEKILSTQASLLARLNGAFPGFLPDVFGQLTRLLPSPTSDVHTRRSGESLEDEHGPWYDRLTVLGRRAAERLNQRSQPSF